MKLFLVIFNFIILINISSSLTPIWNIPNASVELLSSTGSSKEIKVYEKTDYNTYVKLKIKIKNDNNVFSEKNYIQINSDSEIETNFEDIESFYKLETHILICPKGKNFMNEYSGGIFKIINPGNMQVEDDWEFICYYQSEKKYMFNGFLNQPKIKKFYGLPIGEYNNKNWRNRDANDGFYDFVWTWNPKSTQGNFRYNMYGLVLKQSKIQLQSIEIEIDDSNNFSYTGQNSKSLGAKKSFTHGYFNQDNLFYWISCDTIDDCISGYSTESIDINQNHVNYNVKSNSNSPFNFGENMEIKKMNMIRNTNYAYYEIQNSKDNQIYYGIIDIKDNRIIFNTNETLKKFRPFVDNSMLAFTDYGVYQICTIKDKTNNKCIKKCSTGNLILDPENGNYCGEQKQCEVYTLMPENICINNCNRSIYALKDKECGLCKELYPSKKYYYLNQQECIEEKIDKTYYVNEYLNIIADCNENCKKCSSFETCDECEDGYQNVDGKCEKLSSECHPNCDGCENPSTDDNNQMCIKCKGSLLLEKGNCIQKCDQGYYKNDKSCLECNSNCTTCSKGEEKDKNGVIINQNCESCISDLNYLIKAKNLPSNCVDECPDGLNATKGNYCEIIDNGTIPIDDDDGEDSDYMLWIFIILIALLLLIIFICICKRHCSNKKNDGSEMMNDINTELTGNDKIVE